MRLTQTTTEEMLTKFREAFPVTKVLQEQDRLYYIFKTFANAQRLSVEANQLIERMGIPLVAIHYGSSSFFTVVSNETGL